MVSDFTLQRVTESTFGQYGEVAFATRGGAPGQPFAIKMMGFTGLKKDIKTSIEAHRHVKKQGTYELDHQVRVYREAVLLRYLSSPFFGRPPHPNVAFMHVLRAHLPREPQADTGVCLVMENGGTNLSALVRATAQRSPTPGAVLRPIPEDGLVLPLAEVRDLAWQLFQGVLYVCKIECPPRPSPFPFSPPSQLPLSHPAQRHSF
jgi:hypothetical protein